MEKFNSNLKQFTDQIIKPYNIFIRILFETKEYSGYLLEADTSNST